MMGLIIGVYPDRVGVTTGVGGRLVNHDLVLAMQQIGGTEARYAGSHYRDLHASHVSFG